MTLPAACEKKKNPPDSGSDAGATASSRPGSLDPPVPLQLLYVPDGGDVALEGARPPAANLLQPPGSRCAPEMVDVAGRFCIDRYEASLIDTRAGRAISPYFPPRQKDTRFALAAFENISPRGAPPLPRPPSWQLAEAFEAKAVAAGGALPNGYVSGVVAREACLHAGKRLCTPAEWVTACRGEKARKFPYGDRYEPGVCNVSREAHPAAVLYGNASKNHLDPRLNLVAGSEGPLLRRTGATLECRSTWGSDAVFDMVGNLDEWVDDPGGAFLGGFYARATQNGCDARVSDHPPEYFDYSLGVRCCR
jgi:hypothetical protein